MQHPKQSQTSNTVPGTRNTSAIPVCPPGIRTNTCATCLLLDSKQRTQLISNQILSKNVPYVQFKYRFTLLFLCYSAIINILFFNFLSLYQLSKYFRQSQLFNFYIYVLLEIRISTYCMNYIFSEDLFPYLIKSFPKRLSLSLCHIIVVLS